MKRKDLTPRRSYVPSDTGKCKDCHRVTRLTRGYCIGCAPKHGVKIVPRWAHMVYGRGM